MYSLLERITLKGTLKKKNLCVEASVEHSISSLTFRGAYRALHHVFSTKRKTLYHALPAGQAHLKACHLVCYYLIVDYIF